MAQYGGVVEYVGVASVGVVVDIYTGYTKNTKCNKRNC